MQTVSLFVVLYGCSSQLLQLPDSVSELFSRFPKNQIVFQLHLADAGCFFFIPWRLREEKRVNGGETKLRGVGVGRMKEESGGRSVEEAAYGCRKSTAGGSISI